jgi:hypothetical protein
MRQKQLEKQSRKKKFPEKISFDYCVCGRYNSTRFQYFVAAMIVIGMFIFQYPPPRPLFSLSVLCRRNDYHVCLSGVSAVFPPPLFFPFKYFVAAIIIMCQRVYVCMCGCSCLGFRVCVGCVCTHAH